MTNASSSPAPSPAPASFEGDRHPGPHLGLLAILYVVLFNAGLSTISAFGIPFGVRPPWFPGPWEPASVIVSYFQTHAVAVQVCMFLQFGGLIPLGLFTAAAASRLRFLGVRSVGPDVVMFGGFMTVFDGAAAGFALWAMAHPAVSADAAVVTALFYLSYAFGGPGFSVPMGLLIAGLSIPAGLRRLLPRWLVVSGLLLALAGELSWLNLVVPQALFLIPLVRFVGFVWLIATGFALPNRSS
jgi:hypothetical protein